MTSLACDLRTSAKCETLVCQLNIREMKRAESKIHFKNLICLSYLCMGCSFNNNAATCDSLSSLSNCHGFFCVTGWTQLIPLGFLEAQSISPL